MGLLCGTVWRRALCLVVLSILIVSVGSSAAGDVWVQVGETITVPVTLYNSLNRPATHEVEVNLTMDQGSGSAVLRADAGETDQALVAVGANSTRAVVTAVTGERCDVPECTGTIVIRSTSLETRESTVTSLDVVVYRGSHVHGAPGLGLLHLFIIMLAGGFLAYRFNSA